MPEEKLPPINEITEHLSNRCNKKCTTCWVWYHSNLRVKCTKYAGNYFSQFDNNEIESEQREDLLDFYRILILNRHPIQERNK